MNVFVACDIYRILYSSTTCNFSAKYAVAAIKKKIFDPNPHVAQYALTVSCSVVRIEKLLTIIWNLARNFILYIDYRYGRKLSSVCSIPGYCIFNWFRH